MNRTDLVKDKWAQSGWKIEQKYGNKVLLGNWAEDRLQFTRELKIADSSSRRDYQPHWDFKPDVSARRSSLMRAEGHPFKTLFAQSGQPSAHYLVTEYQESYGKKISKDLPTLQPRHPFSLTGQLGRPISGLPTNFGRLQSQNSHFRKQKSLLPLLTVHRTGQHTQDTHLMPSARAALPGLHTSSPIMTARSWIRDSTHTEESRVIV